MGMQKFKRDNELVEKLNEWVDEMPNSYERAHLVRLIHLYAYATFPDWKDKDKFTADFIEDAVNDFGFADDLVAETMSKTHNTLQQNFMRLCVKFIKRMAEKEHYDARNEASVRMARRMLEAAKEDAYLPCI